MQRAAPASGFEKVLIPGDPEHAAAADSRINGIPLDPVVRNDLDLLAKQLDLLGPLR